MKIFIAGASGAIGKRLIPILVSSGHQVVATTTTAAKVEMLRSLGAVPIIADGLNRQATIEAVQAARPDVVVHQMTALASMRSLKHFDRVFAVTNRLRTEGTANLLAAARAADVKKFIAQSYTGWPNQQTGGRVKTEDDPLLDNPPADARESIAAIRKLEEMVTNAKDLTGIVLRYGSFYGPGTSLALHGDMTEMIRARKLPLVGIANGVWSFIHIDDAAGATQMAIERDISAGIYNVVDNEPAEVKMWLPYLAETIGAKPPRHIPAWIAGFAIGQIGVDSMTKIRGSSNAKAKRVLGWKPNYSSWREGFARGLEETPREVLSPAIPPQNLPSAV